MTSKIEELIDELGYADQRRIAEITTQLEGVITGIECKLPSEDDAGSSYECQNIPQAREVLRRIIARSTSNSARDNASEQEPASLNDLTENLKRLIRQIPL